MSNIDLLIHEKLLKKMNEIITKLQKVKKVKKRVSSIGVI